MRSAIWNWVRSHCSWLLALALVASLAVLGSLTLYASRSPYVAKNHRVGDTATLTIDASKRSIISRGEHTCAEPSPDASATIATELSALLSGSSGDDDMTFAADVLASSSIERLFERTQGIQAIRDGMFRLCEANMNEGISEAFYEELMIDLVTTLNFIVPLELCIKATLDFQILRRLVDEQRAFRDAGLSDTDADLPDIEESLRTADAFMASCSNLAFQFGASINETALLRLENRRRAAFEIARQELDAERELAAIEARELARLRAFFEDAQRQSEEEERPQTADEDRGQN